MLVNVYLLVPPGVPDNLSSLTVCRPRKTSALSALLKTTANKSSSLVKSCSARFKSLSAFCSLTPALSAGC